MAPIDFKFEPVVTLGTLVEIVSVVVTVMIAYTKFVARMTKLETKMNILWSAFQRKIGPSGDDSEFFQ